MKVSGETVLFTACDEAYAALAELTAPRMATYALKYGMQFQQFGYAPDGLNIYWSGVAHGLTLLKREWVKRVIYLDIDQMVTNMDVDVAGTIPHQGFHCSKDWGNDAVEPWQFSMCGFVAHKDCIDLFEAAINLEEPFRDKPFQEQAPMQYLYKVGLESDPETANKLVHIHPRRVFNAVPLQVCPGDLLSQGVPEPWQPGDFAAHLTMLKLPERIALFHEIRKLL